MRKWITEGFSVEKVWLKQYQEGVPYEIDVNEHSTLVSMFEDSCRLYASKVAFENFGHKLSYKQFNEQSLYLAAYLQSLGLEKGSRIAIMLPNVLQYPIALFAILRAGYIVVNTNPLYTVDEVIYQMNDSGAEAIIVMANFAFTVEKALAQTSIKHIIITEIGDCFSLWKRSLMNFYLKWIKKSVPSYSLTASTKFNEALDFGKKTSFSPVALTHQDIAFLQYTGGTTGISKGAMLTHRNMVANLLQAYYWILPSKVNTEDIIITALPLYHIFSLTANCLTFVKAGAKNILITNPRDIPNFISIIKNSKFTAITGVNTLFNSLLNNPKLKEIDFSHLKLALAGGMALQKSVAARWQNLTKTRLLEAYGLTETCPAVSINPMYISEYNGSIGLPLSSTDVSIRDESNKEVAIGQPGELCIKGPQVMLGYWHKPLENKRVFTSDGFLKTGDIAIIDSQGYLYIVDRLKDMIIVSGFNVYPNEIEQVISLMPEVHEVGVIGVSNDDSGEIIKAFIVKKQANLKAEAVIAHCREHLTAYKIPKIIEFVIDLPKSNVGKILRRKLGTSS